MAGSAAASAGERAYSLLASDIRSVDQANGGAALRLMAGMVHGSQHAVDLTILADPARSVTGTCELVNPAAAPRAWLAWLGWMVGLDTSTLPDSGVRGAIADAVRGQRRGSVDSIRAAVERTLTGARTCSILIKPPLDGGLSWDYDFGEDYDFGRTYDGTTTDPYGIIVVTQTVETPDTTATLIAALSEKPAGMWLDLQTLDGQTYADLATEYPTYAGMRATNRTYVDLASTFE